MCMLSAGLLWRQVCPVQHCGCKVGGRLCPPWQHRCFQCLQLTDPCALLAAGSNGNSPCVSWWLAYLHEHVEVSWCSLVTNFCLAQSQVSKSRRRYCARNGESQGRCHLRCWSKKLDHNLSNFTQKLLCPVHQFICKTQTLALVLPNPKVPVCVSLRQGKLMIPVVLWRTLGTGTNNNQSALKKRKFLRNRKVRFTFKRF